MTLEEMAERMEARCVQIGKLNEEDYRRCLVKVLYLNSQMAVREAMKEHGT